MQKKIHSFYRYCCFFRVCFGYTTLWSSSQQASDRTTNWKLYQKTEPDEEKRWINDVTERELKCIHWILIVSRNLYWFKLNLHTCQWKIETVTLLSSRNRSRARDRILLHHTQALYCTTYIDFALLQSINKLKNAFFKFKSTPAANSQQKPGTRT